MFVNQSRVQRPVTTAHLAQTMSFLALSTTELEATLLKELDGNPALELVDELRCPGCGRRLQHSPCAHCMTTPTDGAPVVYLSPREYASYHTRTYLDDAELEPLECGVPERLDEHILRQIGPALEIMERPVAAYILARLDDDGLLPESSAEVAAYCRVRTTTVERVLSLVQRADPPGIAAQTPQEALLIQLECLAETGSSSMNALARVIILEHFDALGKRDHARIARRLRVPLSAVETAARFIHRNLTPYPARAFWGDGKYPEGDVGTLRNPDVNISQLNRNSSEGCLMVEVMTPLAGWLRVNPEFKAAFTECSDADRDKWAPVIERAALVAKCVQQRNQTMRRLMEIVATQQRAFILGGDGDLRPLTRAQIAKALGVHESTISRAVAGKSAALPNGRIVPLAKFFDRSLSVRDRVRVLVEAETRPMTDDDIAGALASQGIHVARRTVAKYRNMLGILPANVRARLSKAAPPSHAYATS
jgi:RNA polymerase sigma-54 factor